VRKFAHHIIECGKHRFDRLACTESEKCEWVQPNSRGASCEEGTVDDTTKFMPTCQPRMQEHLKEEAKLMENMKHLTEGCTDEDRDFFGSCYGNENCAESKHCKLQTSERLKTCETKEEVCVDDFEKEEKPEDWRTEGGFEDHRIKMRECCPADKCSVEQNLLCRAKVMKKACALTSIAQCSAYGTGQNKKGCKEAAHCNVIHRDLGCSNNNAATNGTAAKEDAVTEIEVFDCEPSIGVIAKALESIENNYFVKYSTALANCRTSQKNAQCKEKTPEIKQEEAKRKCAGAAPDDGGKEKSFSAKAFSWPTAAAVFVILCASRPNA